MQPQEHLPARKVYTITPKGQTKLHEWVQSAPEPPQRKQLFLIQLAWADRLGAGELEGLLAQYAEEVQMELLRMPPALWGKPPALWGKPPALWGKPPALWGLGRAHAAASQKSASDRARFLEAAQARTPHEALLWTRIQHNWSAFYENELAWVTRLRAELTAMENKKNEP